MALPDQFRELLKYRCHVGAVFCVRERHTIRQIQQGMVFIIKGGRFAGHQEPVLFQQVNPRLVHEMAEIAADGQSSRGQDTGDVTVPNALPGFRVLRVNSKNSNPKFTGERQIFHYTFLFDAYHI